MGDAADKTGFLLGVWAVLSAIEAAFSWGKVLISVIQISANNQCGPLDLLRLC